MEIEQYIEKNKLFFEQIIVKSFFENEDNYYLLQRVIKDKDAEAEKKLNELFSLFFLKYRLVNYISTLSKNYSVYFDQKERKHVKKNQLTLDDTASILGTLSCSSSAENNILNSKDNLLEIITDERLYKIISRLPQKQQVILKLYFIDGLKINEIAKLLRNTPQNISKMKRKALITIKREIQEGGIFCE